MSIMKREEFYLPSGSPGRSLHCILWQPDGKKPKAVVQIVHGMIEYVGRYEEFAAYLAEKGYAVVGHDHLGHGKTAAGKEELGYFSEKDGHLHVIGDMYRVTRRGRELWPDSPLVILGHSMGSYFTRKYLTKYSRKVDGAVIMGTGYTGRLKAGTGRLLAGLVCRVKGDRYRSPLLHTLTLGGNNRRIRSLETENDWLSHNRESVEAYGRDPFCTFRFTAGAYRDFFTILKELAAEKDFDRMDKSLPVLFVSGEEDPVGGYGKGVRRCFRQFQDMGFSNVSMKLYPGDRHEILNELDRAVVYDDIEAWIRENVKSR